MGTEVLRPQNCLADGVKDPPATIQRRRNKRPPVHHRRRFSSGEFTQKSIIIPEKVRILRRGQSFDSSLSPELFAGSSLALSPPPSSLPLPSFSRKEEKNQVIALHVDDSASRDLRRLLRLEF